MAKPATAREERDAREPRPRARRRERPRVPLVLKLFLMTALLIVVVISIAIGVTIQRANSIATKTVNDAITNAASLFKQLEQNRLQRLSLGASATAQDVTFNAYIERAIQSAVSGEPIAESPAENPDAAPVNAPGSEPPSAGSETASTSVDGGPDITSILDQLQQRKTTLGSDLLILTDDQGVLLARTDQSSVVESGREDLYETQPLVKASVDANEANSGVLTTEGKLYHAAVAPLVVGAGKPPIGYFINAYSIDEEFANQIAKTTQTGVVFLSKNAPPPNVAARSVNAPAADSMRGMSDVSQLLSSGKMIRAHQTEIDQSSYIVTGEPLESNGTPVGGAVFVRSLDTELAPFREIQRTLIIAGAIALLLAFILSWLIAKRLTRPIERLADLAQSVTEGDYSILPESSRADEIGMLSRSFGQMVSALRDKAEIEELYEQMSAKAQSRTGPMVALQPPKSEEGTILVTDLRGTPTSTGEGEAASVIELMAKAMRLQENEVRRQDGSVREIVGHRLVSMFPGERGVIHAIRAARAISEELAAQIGATNPLTIGAGIATGEFVSGSVELSGSTGTALVGNAPLLALLFAWEAPTGYAFISLESAQTAGSDVITNAAREEVRLRWLPAPLQVASIPLQSLTTGMMQSMGGAATSQMTMRLSDSAPGVSGVSADLSSGTVFANRYQIEQVLGRGGMGVVYKANDTQLDETVAIKTLPGDVMSRSPEELERFKREIRLARKITHRNVLRTYDYGEADGVYFISMEFVRGYTLADLLVQTPQLASRVAMGIARQISRGLEAAHEQGIIHRDIKPQNVLIDNKGEVKLMDFGIARMAEAKEAMTQAGMIIGTPHYMSPEQVQGKTLDARSDVYSMGILMYEMLCGVKPFNDPALTAILTAHITKPPRPPIELRPEIGSEVNRILLRCLAKDPKERYTTAGDLLADLDALQASVAA